MREARYFFVPDAAANGELPHDEAVHATRVLRLKSGDEIFLIDGAGTFHKAEVTLVTNRSCLYRIKESAAQEKEWRGRIHLAIAPTKNLDRMEWLVEKATEIGFDELSLLDCQFSERKTLRKDRLEKIVVSAVKQSRKAWLPVINDMVAFEEFVRRPMPGRKYIAHCYTEVEREDLFSCMNSAETGCDTTILIGPEGDFSIDEVRLAVACGCQPVSLGRCRLRTETAGLYAVMMSQLVLRK